MAKLVVIYDQPKDQEGFENYYFNVHIPLAAKLPNITGAEVHRVLQKQNTSDNQYLLAELHFENPAILAQSLATPEGREVTADVANMMQFLNKPPVVLIVD
ncbi:EthD family reductase [Neobacillus sp. 114]|uniref:EthD family reductase n=1 Tax=Neobacillus sp. 114 TaxID=3048535 RepID=UPI001C21B889|nr:EthD family reductase [Neobacillus sp. 114]MBU8918078.1 EthD family reductase [Bacillus sp. FJAT-29953]